MGVVFARAGDDDRIIAIARNGERGLTTLGQGQEAEDSDTAPAADEESSASEESSDSPEESTDA